MADVKQDWAYEISEALLAKEEHDRNVGNDYKLGSDIAAALRKAKADGMVEAAQIANEWSVSILQFPKEDLQDHVEAMMNEIGPNISEAILEAASKLDPPTT